MIDLLCLGAMSFPPEWLYTGTARVIDLGGEDVVYLFPYGSTVELQCSDDMQSWVSLVTVDVLPCHRYLIYVDLPNYNPLFVRGVSDKESLVYGFLTDELTVKCNWKEYW